MKIKELVIDDKRVRFAASASIPRLYRNKFDRDIILDMKQLQDDMQEKGQNDEREESNIPIQSLNIFENIAYIMARHVDNSIPESVYDWLDRFDTFSIYTIFPELADLWNMNNKTMSVPKKK